MAKAKRVAVESKKNLTASAAKRSAFQRRKEYAAQLRCTKSTNSQSGFTVNRMKKNEAQSTTVLKEKNPIPTSVVTKFKARITKEEMEELGCMPVGILANGSISGRESKNSLSFSPRTIQFENTPLRGTPVRSNSLIEKTKEDKEKELNETLKNLENAYNTDAMSAEDVLTDLNGLELGRKSTVQDVSAFWLLKMNVLLETSDIRQACIAGLHALFSAETKAEKSTLFETIQRYLTDEIAKTSESVEVKDVQDKQDNDVDDQPISSKEVEISSGKPNSVSNVYTPPDVASTPVIRTNSAAKTLRFTPLLASSHRRNSIMSFSSKLKRNSFKLTPLRRSKRLAGMSLPSNNPNSFNVEAMN